MDIWKVIDVNPYLPSRVPNTPTKLRKLLPTYPIDKKLSKQEILKKSIKYIKLLEGVLDYFKKQDGQSSSTESYSDMAESFKKDSYPIVGLYDLSQEANTYDLDLDTEGETETEVQSNDDDDLSSPPTSIGQLVISSENDESVEASNSITDCRI